MHPFNDHHKYLHAISVTLFYGVGFQSLFLSSCLGENQYFHSTHLLFLCSGLNREIRPNFHSNICVGVNRPSGLVNHDNWQTSPPPALSPSWFGIEAYSQSSNDPETRELNRWQFPCYYVLVLVFVWYIQFHLLSYLLKNTNYSLSILSLLTESEVLVLFGFRL